MIICGGPVLAKKNAIFFPRLESGLLQDKKLIFLSSLSGTEVLFEGEGQSGQYRCKLLPISVHHFFCSN